MIRETNKEKRLVWCKERLEDDESFEDVVFSDECSVEQDSHGRLCFRRKKEPRKLKPCPKHPVKVHVWAGILHRGPTPVVIFTGALTSTRYCTILEQGLIPFLKDAFPAGQ